MFPSTLAIPVVLLVTFLLFILSAALLHRKHGGRQPPGPRGLPIIGNLHMLGKSPHRSLQALAKTYGPIMSLRLGQVNTIVVSSPEAAELFLKTHDNVFASRPKLHASKYVSYDSKGVVFAEYGPYWRQVRKLCTLQLLSASKVEFFAPLRNQELGLVVKSLREAAVGREIVDLSEVVGKLIEDMMYKMIMGSAKDDRFDLKGLVHEALSLVGTFNIADYLPWLKPFDLQGLTRRLKKSSEVLDAALEEIVQEHEQALNAKKEQKHKDFVDILLSFMNQPVDTQDEYVINRTNIKAVIFDMIAGGFDTSAIMIAWALSELMRHPRVMTKLQEELESVVGMSRMVEEFDLPHLSYLDMVVKEISRQYPVGPLLVPRESLQDITVNGYFIKKKSRIIVNTWAIGRDSKVWSDNPETFYPERFTNSNMDLRGHDFQLLPFGSGRRGCPGIQLGLITVKLVLAQLVHCFHWELPAGMVIEDLDMKEKFGLTMPRAQHLLVVPSYRILSEEAKSD